MINYMLLLSGIEGVDRFSSDSGTFKLDDYFVVRTLKIVNWMK